MQLDSKHQTETHVRSVFQGLFFKNSQPIRGPTEAVKSGSFQLAKTRARTRSSLLRVSPLHLDEERKEKHQKEGGKGEYLYGCQGTLIRR